MLYVTTRNKHDAFTAHHAVHEPIAPDGGLYVPFRLPVFESQQVEKWLKEGFGACVADVLNSFFACGITAWEVEFGAGRHPLRLSAIGRRVTVCELWHNMQNSYDYVEMVLTRRITGSEEQSRGWVRIAVRIAVLAGMFVQLMKSEITDGTKLVDISVCAGDFALPMACWYLREMGFPVGKIICACNDNSAVWELLRHGELKTDVSLKKTATPLADATVPAELERLIFGTLGQEEACRYASCVEQGQIFAPRIGMLDNLRKGMYATVTSDRRTMEMIPNVCRTTGYLMGPYTALSYAGLMDYRAKTGQTSEALLLADRSAVLDREFMNKAMGEAYSHWENKL